MTLHEPNSIEVLLAIYRGTFHTQYLRSRFPTTGDTVVNDLLKQGLVEMRPDPFDLLISDKGKQFVERLLNTPLEPPAPVIGDHLRKETSLRREVAGKTDHVINQGAQALETFKRYMTHAGNTDDRDFEFNIWRAVRQLGWIVEEHLAKEQKS